MQITQISSQEIQAHLIPLIKTQLLIKEPAAHCFLAEDVLRVNWNYKSRLYKNKIAVMSSKVAKEAETQKVQGKVEEYRKYACDAAIIKVMKARMTIEYTALVTEAINLLRLKFNPDTQQIKQRIEHLIERGYIERDENDKRIFKYLA